MWFRGPFDSNPMKTKPEKSLHGFYSLVLHCRRGMRVEVQSDTNLAMAEPSRDDLRVNSLAEKKRGGRVSQIMRVGVSLSGPTAGFLRDLVIDPGGIASTQTSWS